MKWQKNAVVNCLLEILNSYPEQQYGRLPEVKNKNQVHTMNHSDVNGVQNSYDHGINSIYDDHDDHVHNMMMIVINMMMT